jgi:hypothetical protein
MLKSYLLSLLIGLQTLFGANSANLSLDNRPVAGEGSPTETSIIESKSGDFTAKLQEMGITLHPGTDFTADSLETPISLNHCASLVYKTFQLIPADTINKVKNLTLYFNSNGRRGLGGGSTIILRCQNVTDSELVSVLIHELGHIKDTGVMQGDFWAGESEFHDGKNKIYNNDQSLEFYRISFENEKLIKKEHTDLDFVSGYAKTDPFEDFAETYNYYLLHGDNFRKLIKNNQVLEKKYLFMKEKIFDGKEFDFKSQSDLSLLSSRKYDSTLIGYDLSEFLAF